MDCRSLLVAALSLGFVGSSQGQSFEVLHAFEAAPGGPAAPLLQASDGSLYGTTAHGGEHGQGSVFRVDGSGTVTTLHSFSGRDGREPRGRLAEGGDGFLYGTTAGGGEQGNDPTNHGTVFRIDAAGHLTTIHSFDRGQFSNGARPLGGLLRARNGYLYGTASEGGPPWAGAHGTIFFVDGAGPGRVQAVSYFMDGDSFGFEPRGELVALAGPGDERICGATYRGGEAGLGTIFCFEPAFGGVSRIHSFSGGDGASPLGSLFQAADGLLYGTTEAGGPYGRGVIFNIHPFGGLTVLREILEGEPGFANPIVQGPDGAFYGTMRGGGEFYPGGLIFRLDAAYDIDVLHGFTDRSHPQAGLVLSPDGHFYGTTAAGGQNGQGTVFRFAQYQPFTVLHEFSSPPRPVRPSGLLQAADGSFYGVTALGGTPNLGTLFRMDVSGQVQVLHSFNEVDGAEPYGRLIQGSDGHLYGTATRGGANGEGVVFRFDLGHRVLAVVHSFRGLSDGARPEAGLVQASDGSFYGTTVGTGGGRLFRIDGSGAFTNLYPLSNPSGLIQARDGFLYGTTREGFATPHGSVFRADPAGGGVTTLHSFSVADGRHPRASLYEDADGLLYGTTAFGGSGGDGTVFRIDTSGHFASLTSLFFNAHPHAPIARGADGRLYGVTREGGAHDAGTVFVRDAGFWTHFQSFDDSTGRYPEDGLVSGADGALYGTTTTGGPRGGGVIFRIPLQFADLSVTKRAAPDPVREGGVVTYTLTVTNLGRSPATNVQLADYHPYQLVFLGASAECATDGANQVVCPIPSLAPGASASVDMQFQVGLPAGTVVTNIASAFSPDLDPNPGNNTASAAVTVEAPQATILSPRAGARWAVGSTRSILWSHNLGPDAVFNLSLLRDGQWEVIAEQVPAQSATTGRFDWVVTGPVSQDVMVGVDIFVSGRFAIAEPFVAGPGALIQTVSGNGSPVFDGDFGDARELGQDPTFFATRAVPFPISFVGDGANHRIRQIFWFDGFSFTFAGDGTEGNGGDGGLAANAQLGRPSAGVLTPNDQLYFADSTFGVVRRIDVGMGAIFGVAGSGVNGYGGDGGPATSAVLDGPLGLAVDADGNVFIADTGNHRIRRVDAATGIIDTIAGSGTPGFSGDGGPAGAAQLSSPAGLALDGEGNLYLADSGNHRVRRIALGTGVITTVAGDGGGGSGGDGGPAVSAGLSSPLAVAVDAAGRVLIADTGNHRIRLVDAASGIIDTVAGTGTPGFSGDDGLPLGAQLNGPRSLTLDERGRLFIADGQNARVRRVAPLDADVSVTIEDGRSTVAPGETVTYTITVLNAGPRTQEAVHVVVQVPPTLVGASWTCSGTEGGSCSPSGSGPIDQYLYLPAGARVAYVMTGTVDEQAVGTLELNARLTPQWDLTDPASNNTARDINTVRVVADLAVTKSDGLESATAGRPTSYTITITNAGPGDVSAASVTDVLPAALLGPTWTCQAAGGATCSPAGSGNIDDTVALPAGASATYSVSATIDPSATGTLANTATVSAPPIVHDPAPGNNTATDTTIVTPPAPLTVTVPNTAVSWRIGTAETIRFDHNLGAGEWVLVLVSRDNIYSPVALVRTTAAAGTQSVSWGVTGPPTSHARVHVVWLGGWPLVHDASDTDFVIAP